MKEPKNTDRCCVGAEIPGYGHSRNCPVVYPNNQFIKSKPEEHQTKNTPAEGETLTKVYRPPEPDLKK